MKELSTEEKAKAYDEALEKAKEFYILCKKCGAKDTIDYLEDIFPELKESEDERTWVINYLSNRKLNSSIIAEKENLKKAIAWLEKQTEHANFLSKIQVGDKVTRNEDGVLVNPSQLKRIAKKECEQGTHSPSFDEAQGTPIVKYAEQKYEPKFHEGEWVFIEEIKGYKRGPFQIKAVNEFGYHFDEYHIIPFMYEELLSKWTIQDAKDGDVLFTYECGKPKIVFILKGAPEKPYVLGYHCFYNIMYPHFEFDSEKGCLAPNEEDVKPATKEQRNLLFQKMKESGYVWDAEKKELKRIIVPIFNIGDTIAKKHNSDIHDFGSFTITDITGGKYWYNDRIICTIAEQNEWEILPQPKQEWSKEDNDMLYKVVHRIEQLDHYWNAPTDEKMINWLKSIRPQNRWKPSIAQLNALSIVSKRNATDDIEAIVSLYNDLKKLIEE